MGNRARRTRYHLSSRYHRVSSSDTSQRLIELYKNNRFTLEEFKPAANEALQFTATEDSLRGNIEHVTTRLEYV